MINRSETLLFVLNTSFQQLHFVYQLRLPNIEDRATIQRCIELVKEEYGSLILVVISNPTVNFQPSAITPFSGLCHSIVHFLIG